MRANLSDMSVMSTSPTVQPLRVLLEVIPGESLLAAMDEDADLAGNPHAAEHLSRAGLVVDSEWPSLGISAAHRTVTTMALAGRPRFDRLRDAVSRVGEALPFDVPVPGGGPRSVLFRGELPPGDSAREALDAVQEHARVVRVYADPPIALCACRRPRDPAYGTVEDVARLLDVERLHRSGLDGRDVSVVLVDAGINLDFLHERARPHPFDESLSCAAGDSGATPGSFPVGHGTMAAFQIGIGAPRATLVDHAVVLAPSGDPDDEPRIAAWLSDIAPGYASLRDHLKGLEPAARRLVVSNSWALINPAWDFPAGPRNYSSNPQHPFLRLVRELVDLGADVLFAAGNCGEPFPVAGCGFDFQPICGANSLPEVITVGGVDIDGLRVGYSSQGPGRLELQKPDICGYTHYQGSRAVPRADWGTSAACPQVAGIVAAVRSKRNSAELSPNDLHAALTASARRTRDEFSPDVGWGIVDAAALLERLGL